MAQVKIYGLAAHLDPIKARFSDLVHGCLVDALGLPADKRFQRFFPLEPDNFIYPADRSAAYTQLEILLMSGRTVAARKRLIRLLFERAEAELGISPADLEICLIESDPANWGFRGLHGDEVKLTYRIDI